MKAEVEPSFTESMRPRMSLFTGKHLAGFEGRNHGHTLEFEVLRGPTLLQCHNVGHGLASATQARNSDRGSLEI